VVGSALIAAAAMGIFLVEARRRADEAARTLPAFPVSTAAARQGDFPVYLTAMGTVGAWNTVTVRSRIDGQLMALHFTDGQSVREGDLLAEIDPRAYQTGLEQAQGALARDRAALEEARQDLTRYQQAGDSVTSQQIDTAKSAVNEDEAVVRADRAAVDNYRLQLDFCRIVAPVSGRLGLRAVDAGNMIQATDPSGLVVINQDQPIAVFFSIPEINLPAIRSTLASNAAQKVEALDESTQQVIATGTVFALDNQIDVTTGTIRLKALFQNPERALFPNQFVNVRFLLNTVPAATLIPLAAVEGNENAHLVFVVRPDHTVEQRAVVLGDSDEATAVVVKGIKPGEIVVTDNLENMKEGTLVSDAQKSATVLPPGKTHAVRTPRNAKTPGVTNPS
jgi:multidrug efflux system membrane fusion protein